VDPVSDPLLLRKSGSAGNQISDIWVCSQKLWLLDYRGLLTTDVDYSNSSHPCDVEKLFLTCITLTSFIEKYIAYKMAELVTFSNK
jgi:hypothetical protein